MSASVAASANEGIGVPAMPVRNRMKMSRAVAPPRNVQGIVKSAIGSGWLASFSNFVWTALVPRPSVPWHAVHLSFA